jgi:Zn-dependent peptidase ImmA (M78 family)
MKPIVVDYPHWRPSFEPRHLRREEIWKIADAARRQICGVAGRPKVALSQLMARTRRLRVNGISVDLHWELTESLADEFGNPAMGCTSHDERWSNAAMICLNAEAIGERDDLARSTAAHELGHSIFEAPAWIARREKRHDDGPAPQRRYQPSPDSERDAARMQWSEWRANEFMGAFLAPPRLLHLHAHKRAAALGLPMTAGDRSLPIINSRKACADSIETVATELAEMFGVSIPFIQMRLQKYRLISAA